MTPTWEELGAVFDAHEGTYVWPIPQHLWVADCRDMAEVIDDFRGPGYVVMLKDAWVRCSLFHGRLRGSDPCDDCTREMELSRYWFATDEEARQFVADCQAFTSENGL